MADMNEYRNKYNKENYFKVTFRIPKEKKEVLQELSECKHKSINLLITEALEKQYGIDLTIDESKLRGDK